jgi:spore germination protein GerM
MNTPKAETSPKHLLALAGAVVILGLGAWYFQASRDAVPGLPPAAAVPTARDFSKFNIYLTNLKLSADECTAVFPVERVTKNDDVPMTALLELLNGPTDAELAEGYDMLIPDRARLNSLKIENGIAAADFDEAFNAVAGSCRVGGIRAEVEATLKQFPGVSGVIISVNGDSDIALQP